MHNEIVLMVTTRTKKQQQENLYFGVVIFWLGGKNCIFKHENFLVFPKSQRVNLYPANGLLLELVKISPCIKIEIHYLLLIFTITQVTVLWRGQFLSPHVTFNIDMVKYKNICKLLKKLQINKKQNIQRNKNQKSFRKEIKMNTKKLVTFQSISIIL